MKQLSRPGDMTDRQLVEEHDIAEDYMSFTYSDGDDAQWEYEHVLRHNMDKED